MSYSLIIPAQDTNRYHKEGDFSPFGDTTLLEWKISQCIEYCNKSDIFISTHSQKATSIAKKNKIGLLHRKEDLSYADTLIDISKKVTTEYVVWVNPTSPFIGPLQYKKVIDTFFLNLGKYDSLITTNEKKEFVYYNNKKINFDNHSNGRNCLEPIYVATNGIYIVSRENIMNGKGLIGQNPKLYNLDYLESLEISSEQTYHFISELISLYFKKELQL
jgi:CMP-N-acetylneuraminic acid synthetase